MLTELQYNALWTNPNPTGFNQPLPLIPPYTYYLLREHFLEDDLDIFRGRNTRDARAIPLPAGVTYPYPHPFFNAAGQPINPDGTERPGHYCIKFVLIAEAAPSGGINYFYDLGELNGQSYLKECYNANYAGLGSVALINTLIFNTNEKISTLLSLAERGVILIDLFPFAINYTKYAKGFRENLILGDVPSNFWSDPQNPYSIINRLVVLEKFRCKEKESIKISLLVTPKIMHHIADLLNHGILPLPHGCTINFGINTIGGAAPPIPPVGTAPLRTPWPIGTMLNGLYIHTTLNAFPFYQCCAYGPSNMTPDHRFITNSVR